MNLLFRATDAAFENAALDDDRCSALLAAQMRLRRAGIILFLVALLVPVLFGGLLVVGDPFKSPVWQWMLSPDSIQSRTKMIELAGMLVLGTISGSVASCLALITVSNCF